MRGEGRTVMFVVLDGVADRPADELDGRTPLEAATTPNLDRLAEAGTSGIVDVKAPGIPMSSDRAHSILFGYALPELPGRGVLEARGFDITVSSGVVASSASFARTGTDDEHWVVADRSVKAHRAGCDGYAESVSEFGHGDVSVRFEYTWKNRGIVTLSSDSELDPNVTDTDPFEAGLPVVRAAPTEGAPDHAAATRTADAIAAYTRWSIAQLADEPVDVVLSKWAGTPTHLEPFSERTGMRGKSFTRKPVLQGLGKTLGMDVEAPPPDYADRPATTLDAVETHDFVHLHYPEPDEVAHAESPTAKRDEIEAIDATLTPLVDRALSDPELVVAVTADHTTPSRGNVVHSGEPVPFTMVGETVRTDDVTTFGERPAAGGGLRRLAGRDVLRVLRATADRVYLDGLRRTPEECDYPATDLDPLSREER